MTISLSEFLAQLAANPVLAVTVALTLGVVLVDGCAQCHRHLCFHPRDERAQRHFNGGCL